MRPEILIVDDDKAHRQMIRAVLGAEGYAIAEAADGKEAVEAAQERTFDLILMDVRMAGMSGIESMKEIKLRNPAIPIIVMTAFASVGTAVDALKSGAHDYLTKPLDVEELKILVAKSLRYRELEKENLHLKEEMEGRFDFANIVSRSSAMSRVLETLALVAPTEATVLITGESGTGKELIANAVHRNSPRKDQAFIKVNCAALPETLLESELFGYEKGAFTGAVSRRQGRFQLAHRSSIFLDEIAEMSQTTQAKILRVLQEREFEPLGSQQTIQVDVRIIAATNKNLEEEIGAGRFREDLYYRLNVVTLDVPPLRARREDIPLLADYFLKRYREKNRKLIKGFSPRAMDALVRYEWPGNARELENIIERAVILTRGEVITRDHFPGDLNSSDASEPDDLSEPPAAGRKLKDLEKEMILRTLEETGGNRTRAADILGISRRTLQLKLKEYAITRSEEMPS